MAPYTSAQFIKSLDMQTGEEVTDQQVVALDEEGREWFIPIPYEECQVGDWLRFVAEGGTVTAYSEAETKPA
jgi:hypothetical protein